MKAQEFNRKYKKGSLFYCPYDAGKRLVRTMGEAVDYRDLGACVEINLNPWFIPVSHLKPTDIN